MHSLRDLSCAVVGIFVSCFALAEAQPAQATLASVLQKLHATDWEVRALAVEELAQNPDISERQKRSELIQLLDRENKSLRDPHRPLVRSDEEGEAYAEYYSMLLGHVDSLIDPGDVQSVSILIKSAYNSDSPLALKWAGYGQTVVPALLEISACPEIQRRADSCEVMGHVLRHHRLSTSRYPLIRRTVRAIENRLRAGLRDPSAGVRMEAIQGVKAAGDVASIPILRQLSMSDPWLMPGTEKYFIRQLAALAITAIQANPLSK